MTQAQSPDTTLETTLIDKIATWEFVGYPALLERYVHRNGRPFVGTKRPPGIRKRKDRHCFQNCTEFVLRENFVGYLASPDMHVPDADEPWLDGPYVYVEGYAMSAHGFLVHHAWVFHRDRPGEAVDLTWKHPETALYWGVPVSGFVLREELKRNGSYGLFDNGLELNASFMFDRDPELEPIIREVMARPRSGLRDLVSAHLGEQQP